MATVDWQLLAAALRWYGNRGFKEIALPWHARMETVMVTCPHESFAWSLDGVGTLVGSAEQAFMERQFDGLLPPGRWVSLTPCFRNEGVHDGLHLPYFMKVELYSNEDRGHDGLALEFACTAREFMLEHGANSVELVETDNGFDLEINGIEVGSYNSREHEKSRWTCGTGLAEPRFTLAARKLAG